MVHDSPTNAMKNYIHHNIDTLSIKYCKHCKHFAPVPNVIKTKISIRLKTIFQPRSLKWLWLRGLLSSLGTQAFNVLSPDQLIRLVSCLFTQLFSSFHQIWKDTVFFRQPGSHSAYVFESLLSRNAAQFRVLLFLTPRQGILLLGCA